MPLGAFKLNALAKALSFAVPEIVATGGTVSYANIGGQPYKIHAFTSTGNSTFTVTSGGSVDVLIVGGGGAGGGNLLSSNSGVGGGGGGAQVRFETNQTVTATAYTITVGAGGSGSSNTSGASSSAFGFTAVGGARGGAARANSFPDSSNNGDNGGAAGGGGQAWHGQGGPTPTQSTGTFAGGDGVGFKEFGGPRSYLGTGGGGNGGAGSGANTSTGFGGAGGVGVNMSSNFGTGFGQDGYFGGGGGGGVSDVGLGGGYGAGGLGGGGSDGAGTANTGGGGGGKGRFQAITGTNGGSGVVLVRYPVAEIPQDYWIARFNRNSSLDGANYAIEDTNGDVFVCGSIGSLSKGYLAKFNSAGTLQFQVSYSGQMGAGMRKMMLTTSGELLILSQTVGNDIGLAVVNKSTGAINSWYEYQLANTVTGWTAALDSSNNVYIAGSIQITTQETLIMKLSASTYDITWQKSYGGAGSEQSLGLAVDSSGNAYVSGQRSTSGTGQIGGQDLTLIKVDTNGNLSWAVNYGGSGSDFGRGCAIDSAGFVYTAGTTASNSYGGNDFWLTKWNTDGTVVWSRNYGSARSETASLAELVTDSSNNIYAVFTAGSASNGNDACLVSFNSSGNLNWSRVIRQNSTTNDSPTSISIRGNNLYVPFTSVFGTDQDAIVAKYPKDNSLSNGTYDSIWIIEDISLSLNTSNSWTRNTTSLTFANTSLSKATPTIPTTSANPFTVTLIDINP
jgi:hypothetical protein